MKNNKKYEDTKKGILYGILATLLWGSYPLWYKPLSEINAYQLLSWRILFAEFFIFLVLIINKKIKIIYTSLKKIISVDVFIISGILALWWLIYIYGILSEKVLEVSFGYFISPIMSMLASCIIFKEKLIKRHKIAMLIAVLGVILGSFESLNFKTIPWIAIIIGACYSIYGILKKKNPGDPIVTQALEISFLFPFALAFIILSPKDQLHVFFRSEKKDALLMATGLITVLPLLWYSIAAKKLPMILLSFIQFIPPICNFLLAVFIYSEPVTSIKMVSFVLIWISLVIIFIYPKRSDNKH